MFDLVSVTVKTCPALPARITIPIQFPATLFNVKARDEDVVVPASLVMCCTNVTLPPPVDVTVKGIPLLAILFTVTTTFPVIAPPGTGTTMLVALQLVGGATVPLNVTELPVWVPKLVPVIVTKVPTGPDVGLRLLIVGGGGAVAGVVATAIFE